MQARAGAPVVAVLLIGLSLIAGPAAAAPVAGLDGSAPPLAASQAETAASENESATHDRCYGGPPDPETDVLGWEAGCWYNESIRVNQTDGLNTSELNATIARGMARVELIRQLEFKHTVPVELETRESFQASRANDTPSPELRRFDNVKFEALFLVGEDEDSIDVQNENAGVAVLGFYSPSRGAIVLISESRSELQLDELTLAHELVHALQDQHFNLSRYDARTRDGANAENGLIEGDASLVEYRYQQRCQGDGPWNGTCLSQSDSGGSGGSLANIGTYLVKFQPYSDGPSFIQWLYNQGGWATVNEAYDDPPASSEQVIHPEKYGEDAPTDVRLEDRQTDAWERVRPPGRPDYGEVGEAALTSMLVFPLYDGGERIIEPNAWLNRTADGEISDFDPLNYETPFTSGWDGDRLHVYVNDANETAYVWRLVWDSPADAEEFVDGYTQVLEYWGGAENQAGLWVIERGGFADAIHIQVEGDTVTIVNAPTVEQLNEVRDGTLSTATPDPTPTPSSPSPTPGPTTMSPSPPTTTPGQPGFGVVVALIGLSAGLLWRRRG